MLRYQASFALPLGKLAIGCKWVYRIKKNSDNTVARTATSITILLIYINDILLTGSDPEQMHSTFVMKELGFINYFLGIPVTSFLLGYFLSQHKYVYEILAKAGMFDCKPYSSSMALKQANCIDDVVFSNATLYCNIVGALQYLAITRLDLVFAVKYACQFM
ncbi:uncharacterized protein LOC114268129 [Camellia sinensis]|uniref:uncharacterized protein LOC114268129 n=1 Tax=Camellia sinensis TaxID=4442 RepID=UPI001035C962|nr:uncharacterized protein LOC114268129 [Camellia sinensis]